MKLPLRILTTLFLLLPFAAHAQSGCIDSPENPTALLALAGTGAAVLMTRFGRKR